MNQNKTAKAKLDAALGIKPDTSIDDFLNSLSMENDSAKKTVDKIDSSVKEEVSTIDSAIKDMTIDSDYDKKAMALTSIETSLKHIDELISISKDVIRHIYENIVCTELVDSELIHAAAAFIESCHLNVKEYIDLYKDRLKFYDKVRMEMILQKNRLELVREKHKLDMEKKDAGAIDVPADMATYRQEDIINALKNQNI